MDRPQLAQAAALLTEVLRHDQPTPCSLEEIEQHVHRRAHQIARAALEQRAQEVVDAAEAVPPPPCACGQQPQAQQRRRRELLALPGLLRLRLRRYRCPACRHWYCPGATALQLSPKQRLTRTLTELLGQYGVAWSFALGARLLPRVLPEVAVSAKTVERCVARCGHTVAAREEATAAAAARAPATAASGPALANPQRPYLALDGVLVRARAAGSWLEVQVASLWSAWIDLPDRKHPRRQITDATFAARAEGWEALGRHAWRLLVERGAVGQADPELVVLGDGASGIRSVWEQQLPPCRALLDPWHLWEKVKERGREVLGRGPGTLTACQAVYGQLKGGAVAAAVALVRGWEARSDWACKRQERLVAYLERNQDVIHNYEQLRADGYLVGAGLMEKANDLVVVPRMKNGKMHWSRSGANRVALLRAHLISDPEAAFLPL
jgi:hypothetical protein